MKLFLDSGAFSLYTKMFAGVNTGSGRYSNADYNFTRTKEFSEYLDNYIKFLCENKEYLELYVGLDIIGNPQRSWEIQKYMESFGLSPLPVYHVGEDIKWLKRYVDNYDYIGCGGFAKDISKKAWINSMGNPAFSIICDTPNRLPRVKVHGFAMTSSELIATFPWYCLTEEHTILTSKGWKTRDSIRVNDMVLTYNEGISEWKPILKVHKFDVVDTPIKKFNGRFTASVTLDHKWYTKTNNKWQWRKTNEFTHHTKIPRTAIHHNFPTKSQYTDELIKLVAWVWTDGSIGFTERRKAKGHKKPCVRIYQNAEKHPQYIIEIEKLLKESRAVWNRTYICNVRYEIGGKIQDDIVDILSIDKKLSFDFILSLTKNQVGLFIDEVLKGDGYWEHRVNGRKIFNLMQKSTRGLDAFGLACILMGIPIQSQNCPNNFENILSSNIKFHTPRSCYEKEELYTGTLWCIEVENHTFFTRCGNSYYWTGNSVDSTSWVQYGKYGAILVPKSVQGKFIYSLSPWVIFVSNRSPKKKLDNFSHLENLPSLHQQKVLQYFADKQIVLGKSEFKKVELGYKLNEGENWSDRKKGIIEIKIEKGISNDHSLRDDLNLQYFLNLEKSLPEWPWPWEPKNRTRRFF